MSEPLNLLLNRIRQIALVAGLVGGIALAVGAFLQPARFFQAYLPGYIFWTQVGLGCLGILLIHHVAGGAWSAVIQRVVEAGALTLPLLALLFIPIILGLSDLYIWAAPEAVAQDEIIQFKAPYLNIPFFIARTALYFVIWIGLAFILSRLSRRYDESGDPALAGRMKTISAPGIIPFFLAANFAAFDWMMSLEPHWFSTMYGVIFTVGAGVAAFAVVIVTMNVLSKYPPIQGVVTAQNFTDLGNFQLATVMLWAYTSFSQYLIIWSGNLAEETPWYLTRTRGGWQYVAIALLAFHFVLPFLMLLSRSLKRKPGWLLVVALLLLLLARPLELFFLIAPAFHPAGLTVHWLDGVAPIALGGLWLAVFIWQLQRRPFLLPQHDPRIHLKEDIVYGSGQASRHAHN